VKWELRNFEKYCANFSDPYPPPARKSFQNVWGGLFRTPSGPGRHGHAPSSRHKANPATGSINNQQHPTERPIFRWRPERDSGMPIFRDSRAWAWDKPVARFQENDNPGMPVFDPRRRGIVNSWGCPDSTPWVDPRQGNAGWRSSRSPTLAGVGTQAMGPPGWCSHPCQVEDRRPLRAPVNQGIATAGVHDRGLPPSEKPESTVNMATEHQGVRPASSFKVLCQWPVTDVFAPC
jgi:hypothetical protein